MSILIYLVSSFIIAWQTPCELKGYVEIDEFNNVYVCSENLLTKFDKSGKSSYNYSAVSNGGMTSVDVSNPLRISIYFENNNEILFLDNTLSEQGRSIELNALDYYDVSLMCNSYQNHIWLYRSAEKQLVRISSTGEVVSTIDNINSWLDIDAEAEIVQIAERGNYLYLMAETGEILIFDQYGTFLYNHHLLYEGRLHFENGRIIFRDDNTLWDFNVKVKLLESLAYEIDQDIIATEVISMDQSSSKLAVLTQKELRLYTFK